MNIVCSTRFFAFSIVIASLSLMLPLDAHTTHTEKNTIRGSEIEKYIDFLHDLLFDKKNLSPVQNRRIHAMKERIIAQLNTFTWESNKYYKGGGAFILDCEKDILQKAVGAECTKAVRRYATQETQKFCNNRWIELLVVESIVTDACIAYVRSHIEQGIGEFFDPESLSRKVKEYYTFYSQQKW